MRGRLAERIQLPAQFLALMVRLAEAEHENGCMTTHHQASDQGIAAAPHPEPVEVTSNCRRPVMSGFRHQVLPIGLRSWKIPAAACRTIPDRQAGVVAFEHTSQLAHDVRRLDRHRRVLFAAVEKAALASCDGSDGRRSHVSTAEEADHISNRQGRGQVERVCVRTRVVCDGHTRIVGTFCQLTTCARTP